jgi:hypothetical protein
MDALTSRIFQCFGEVEMVSNGIEVSFRVILRQWKKQ